MDEPTLDLICREGTEGVIVIGARGEFLLFPLDGPTPLPQLAEATRRGFHFSGVVALVDGEPKVAAESDPDSLFTMTVAGVTWAYQLRCKRADNGGDGEDWLERLHQLPDPRT